MRLCLIFILICQIAFAQFPNVLISKQLHPKGVSIAINPKDTRQQLVGAGMANAYYSEDGGLSWKKSNSICNAYGLFGTPRVFWDTARRAYFTDISFPNPAVVTDGSWVDRIILNHSDSAGRYYSTCEYVGKNGKKAQFRHFASVNPKNNDIHVTWTQFNRFESKASEDSSFVRYSRSSDGGTMWTEPRTISSISGDCKNSDSTLMGAVSCVGPNGEVYVCWGGPKGLMFHSYKNGWAKEEKALAPLRGGWDFKINGEYKANGLPSIVCDNSKGPHKGRVYVSWCDERNGENNEDVFYMYSDDGGDTWVDPVILTYHPNHKAQFMPAMCLDNSTGYLYILYYDQKNHFEDGETDVYLAVSRNGTQKFDYYKVNETSFKPNKNGSFGDYIGVSAVKGNVRPIWMQQDKKKELNVYTAIIDEVVLKKYTETNNDIQVEKMIPFADEIRVNFNIKEKMEISAEITKPLETGFRKSVFKNKKFRAGNNSMLINAKDLALQKGSYILTLYFKNKTTFVWITAE
ncbi:MAG: BNR/Asp-box repeat protein [Bacteroidetes bacterium]|jgi:hypothetical protein|nr:BNR/Asp-box repeat protein [Bacteroidota bacterium]